MSTPKAQPITIRQHIPNFVDGVKPKIATVNSTEALLALPFVAMFSEDPDFAGYAVEGPSRRDNSLTLLATYEDGYRWWVVGRITEGSPDLPKWEAKYREVKAAEQAMPDLLGCLNQFAPTADGAKEQAVRMQGIMSTFAKASQ